MTTTATRGPVGRTTDAVGALGAGLARIAGYLPRTARATGVGARGTTRAFQTLPDPMLRTMAASSVAFGAGSYVAGAPRLAVVAGIIPALIMGVAIVLRPLDRRTHREESRPSR